MRDRVQSMFNYLGGSENPCSMRQVNRNQNSHDNGSSGHDSDETHNTSNRSDRATGNSSSTPSPDEGSSHRNTDMDNSSSHSGGSASSYTSSQLRQMLLSNGDDVSTTAPRSKSWSLSSSGSDRRSSVHTVDEGAYKKFKTNIHQRFTADQEHDLPQPSSSCLLTPTSTSSSDASKETTTQDPPFEQSGKNSVKFFILATTKLINLHFPDQVCAAQSKEKCSTTMRGACPGLAT